MNNDKVFITPEQAESFLNEGENIHTFRNPSAGMMLGADWDREKIIQLFKDNPDKIQLGGEMCRRMKHGIVVDSGGPLFIEANNDKINEFDPL